MVGGEGIRDAADGGPPGTRSVLRSVVVHASGAVCTRRARVAVPVPPPGPRPGSDSAPGQPPPLPAGEPVTVRIADLPPTLYAHSLRARVVSGLPGLRVTDVRVEVGATLRRGEELPGLRLDLEDAEDRRARLRDRRDRLMNEIDEVAGFRAEPPQPRRGEPPRWAPVESILALAGFVDSRLALLHTRLRTAEDELERADHDVDVLRDRLNRSSSALSTDRAEPTVTAVLTLAPADEPPAGPAEATAGTGGTAAPGGAPGGEQGAEADVELEYHVPGASWVPVYQLRLDGRSGAGTLLLRACVAQRTGEDWTGVHLGLSTADLLRRPDLPELRSLRIGRAQEEPPAPGWREPPAGLDELFAGYDSAAASRSRQAHRVSARLARPAVGGADGGAVGGAYETAAAGAASAEDFGYGHGHGEVYGQPAVVAGPLPPAPAAPAGAAPPAPGGAAAPAMAMAPRAQRAPRTRGVGAVPAGGPQPVAPPPGPFAPAPSADLLDYAALTMTGPDAADGRGTLRPGATGTDALVAEYRRRAGTVAALPRPAHAVHVRRSAGSFDYRFDTAAPADVEADGQWHTVPVGEVPVRTEFEYVCVPALDASVFGTVLVTNTSGYPLLAGPADVMVDGDFVRTAALPTLAPGQRQPVGIGVAESVQVARRTHMRESTAGLRGGTTVLDHTVEIEVANRLPYPVVVEVRERVPVSDDKDVRVEEHRSQPAWAEPGEPLAGQDGTYVRGARVWRVTLEPGRTTTLTGGYDIRLPAGKSVVGGNRRT